MGKRGLAVAAVAAGCLAFAAPAGANTYCAVTSANPTIPGTTCTTTFTENGVPAQAVTAALVAAQANPGPDTVAIGSGTFVPQSGSGFAYNDAGNDAVTITGQGTSTILTGNALPNSIALLSITSNAAADAITVQNLSVLMPSGSNANTGVSSAGPNATTIRNVAVTGANSTPQGTNGFTVDDGDLVTGSSVDLPVGSSGNLGASSRGSSLAAGPVIQDSSFSATVGVAGGFAGTPGTFFGKVLRCRIDAAFGVGVLLNPGGLDVQDTFIKIEPGSIGGSFPPAGLTEIVLSSGTAAITARHVTIVGGTGTSDTGAYEVSASGSNQASIAISNSIITDVETTISRNVANSGHADVSLAYSDYDPAKITNMDLTSNPAMSGAVTQGPANLNVDPQFTNAAAGDYSLTLGSPVIDAGTPGALGADESATDVLGNPRILDGNGDLASIRDMGAFEHATVNPPSPPPPDPPPPGGDTTPPDTLAGKFSHKTRGKKLTVRFSSTEAGSTFTCKLDKKAAQSCASPYKLKGLKKGKHTLLVTATDAAGNADLSPAKLGFKVLKPKKKRHHQH